MALPGGRKGAIAGGLFVGLAGLFWFAWHLAHGAGPIGSASAAAAAKRHHDSSGWMPWFFAGKPADDYSGPRIPVTVKVVDLQGDPVASASVDARVDPDEWAVAGLTDEQYDAYLQKNGGEDGGGEEGSDGEDVSIARTTVGSGRTGRDGKWVVDMKPDVSAVFFAHDDRGREGVSAVLYVPALSEQEPDSKGLDVTVEIADLGVLTGTVVDPQGHPIEGAALRLSSWSSEDADDEQIIADGKKPGEERVTGPDGTFRIPLRLPGAFDLEVHAKRFQPALQEAVQVLPGRETHLDIVLQPSAAIAGTVVGPDGNPVAEARVIVQGEPKPGDISSFETVTDDQGAFEAPELAPGSYVIAASADGLRPAELWGIQAGGPPVTLRLTAGGAIHGDVTATREVISSLLASTPDWASEDEPDAAPGDVPAVYYGDVYLAVEGPDRRTEQSSYEVPVAAGVPAEKLRESPSGTLDTKGRYFAQLRLDASGRGSFDVTGLPPGSYVTTVMLGTAIVTLPPVRVYDGGTANVRVDLPQRDAASIGGTVTVSDGKPIVDGTVFVYGGELPSGLSATVGAGGHFEFASIPAGKYMIHAVVTLESDDSDAGAYAVARPVEVHASQHAVVDLVAQSGAMATETGTPTDGEDWGDHPGDEGQDWTAEEGDDSSPPSPSDGKDLYEPDLGVEEIGSGLVVTTAPPAPGGQRLFGGDRITSIDGTAVSSMESWQAMELLYGPKDSICVITANRPATQENVTVSLVRTRPADEAGGDEGW